MSRTVLILRPQPGADRTAQRARAMGLSPLVAPLFTIRPLDWQAPVRRFDAILLTSANAARHAGGGLTSFGDLPCFAVGEATAEAARSAGLNQVRTGPGNAADALAMMAVEGISSALHLCGREHRLPPQDRIEIESIPVYAADAVDRLPPDAVRAIERKAVALLHSPRAASLFAGLVGDRRQALAVAAISAAAAEAAGPGWAAMAVAAEPRDHALLEAAAKLCH